jgi:hypothetical protein
MNRALNLDWFASNAVLKRLHIIIAQDMALCDEYKNSGMHSTCTLNVDVNAVKCD